MSGRAAATAVRHEPGVLPPPPSPLLRRLAGDRAAERTTRVLAFGFLPGAVVFGVLATPAWAAQHRFWPAWWDLPAFCALVVPAIVFGAVAFAVPLGVLRALAGAAVGAALVVLASAPLVVRPAHAMEGPSWIDQIASLGLIAAAIALPAGGAVAVAVAGSALTFVLRLTTDRSDAPLNAAQNAAYVLLFLITFVALGVSSLAAARAADRAEDAATDAATDAAVDAARDREEARINALVHDRVLATLLTAARRLPGSREVGRRDAARALAGLRALLADDGRPIDAVDGEAFVWRVQGVTTELVPDAVFGYEVLAEREVPGDVLEAVLTAAEEALRNTLRHAGAANCTVHVLVDAGTVEVQVIDDGVGFDPDGVPPTRLGISRSIEGRLRALPGGRAQVISTPGVGTRVVLSWTAP